MREPTQPGLIRHRIGRPPEAAAMTAFYRLPRLHRLALVVATVWLVVNVAWLAWVLR